MHRYTALPTRETAAAKQEPFRRGAAQAASAAPGILQLQSLVGNQAMVRMLQARSGANPIQRKSSRDVVQLTAKEGQPTTPKWENNANGSMAGAPEIQNKKNHPGVLKGGQPSVKPEGWNHVLSNAGKVKGAWVRFHLINENVGGPGNNVNNLVPTTHAINTGSTWSGYETDLKSHYENNEWIWTKTNVTYDASYPSGFPKKIQGISQYYDAGKQAWVSMAKSGTSLDLTPPQFAGGIKTRTLDEMTASTWALLLGLGEGTKLVHYLNHLSSSASSIDDFNEALYEENAPDLEDSVLKRINAAIKGSHPLIHIAVDYA
ncbi:hypothetical protein FE782_01395 [Paenibacillus antri]|uniref:Type VII secretion system protein EssD-like domain-containing protein n=1 Tax=Paenibacillus antri TaxID=2582848 RepID=A0A5R9GLM1_9BACL|nr:DNA/RNA non-specific endonuclease [Paenibacillus antri]TLS54033.1 hypothetical protein FE782_01395 [Paenibacillus antri]